MIMIVTAQVITIMSQVLMMIMVTTMMTMLLSAVASHLHNISIHELHSHGLYYILCVGNGTVYVHHTYYSLKTLLTKSTHHTSWLSTRSCHLVPSNSSENITMLNVSALWFQGGCNAPSFVDIPMGLINKKI